MQIWTGMDQRMTLGQAAAHARRAESCGCDGLNVPEAVHDGLLGALSALQATARLRVATSVLVAFPRSPMVVAHASWDLQQASGGRFVLGLGSQVRGNIVGRYSTEWTPPVPRMREYVQAVRAIWRAWQHGERLDFRGEHYQFTRMQPFFNPGPIGQPEIPLFLGAVGPAMTALAGELADGLMTHPTNSSPRYLAEVTRPQLEKGEARASRRPGSTALMAAGFVATGPDGAAVRAEREKIRGYLGFLYSTPAYGPSLELYGWGEVGRKLHQLSRNGDWGAMSGAISDEMLDTLVPSAPYDQVAQLLRERFAGLATHLTLTLPEDPRQDAQFRDVVASFRA